jgi:proliferating cell nuclear antigen
MRFKTIQASAFKATFEVMKDILNDVNIYISKNGFSIITLDTARVALVDIYMAAENFEEFECETPVYAGVNVSNMYKLLKMISNSDILTVSITSPEYLDISIENNTRNTHTNFKLKLLDIDDERIEVPKINMTIITTMPSSDFQRICRDMNNIANEITVVRHNDQFEVSCDGDFAQQNTVIKCSDEAKFDGRISGTYSLKYLNLFTKATGMCSIIQIMQEEENRFLVLKYNIANLGELKFYLATKIEDE